MQKDLRGLVVNAPEFIVDYPLDLLVLENLLADFLHVALLLAFFLYFLNFLISVLLLG